MNFIQFFLRLMAKKVTVLSVAQSVKKSLTLLSLILHHAVKIIALVNGILLLKLNVMQVKLSQDAVNYAVILKLHLVTQKAIMKKQ